MNISLQKKYIFTLLNKVSDFNNFNLLGHDLKIYSDLKFKTIIKRNWIFSFHYSIQFEF